MPREWERDPKMATWVQTQRQQFSFRNQDKSSAMTDERIGKLKDIGFEMTVEAKLEDNWNASLAKVVKFKEEHGHCNVPRDWEQS